ncbi:TIGR04347 family pseudo-SAM/SPASM protein [Halococcoides cellulosivorans]|uniref:Radical SAM/SPASM domain-containing protein n=1 Tax=Halococcoides cellulosivorans TaxID=1679096 RepID=A0A2R4WZN4_9EURY|nr:TIGR04347 family pseudo-SAM/SPASM protein [Halococcoides cellulosivorans]AWB27013.1 radical SAM/SPASM domain-containing protein [Halococcoides cellulosivorans]
MISVSKLLTDLDAPGDGLRYDDGHESDAEQISQDRPDAPVVVWNLTAGCNLTCEHCYADADEPSPEEFDTDEGKALIDDLAAFGVPVLLFSGGEPLVRDDLEELVAYATDQGLRAVLSTNGTLLDEDRAAALKEAGLAYAGVSVDGLPETHDAIRGEEGAFDGAMAGIEACQAVGLDTGIRFTVTERNVDDLEELLDIAELRGIDRVCVYHLSYGGRGEALQSIDLSPVDRREVVRRVFDVTLDAHERGFDVETLLVGNYADAGLIIDYAETELGAEHADRVRQHLATNGGDPTGDRVADIDHRGRVHPNQFWQSKTVGNVREQSFEEIWRDDPDPLLERLRDREAYAAERCRECEIFEYCGGGSPVRSAAVHGDPFAPDPQCHLPTRLRTGGDVSAD